jgi:hypothetical protein
MDQRANAAPVGGAGLWFRISEARRRLGGPGRYGSGPRPAADDL